MPRRSGRLRKQKDFTVTVNNRPYRKVRSEKEYASVLKELRKKNIKVRLV